MVLQEDAFLRRTGQAWKLVAVGIVAIGAVAFALPRLSSATGDTAEFVVILGILIGALELIALMLHSIRCPQCRTRLFWAVFTDPQGEAALTSFLSRRDCAACGCTPGER